MKIVNEEKKLVDKLVEECTENIDGNERTYNASLNDHKKVCNSCIIYTVLLVIFFIISISISNALAIHWNLKRRNTNTETTIY